MTPLASRVLGNSQTINNAAGYELGIRLSCGYDMELLGATPIDIISVEQTYKLGTSSCRSQHITDEATRETATDWLMRG